MAKKKKAHSRTNRLGVEPKEKRVVRETPPKEVPAVEVAAEVPPEPPVVVPKPEKPKRKLRSFYVSAKGVEPVPGAIKTDAGDESEAIANMIKTLSIGDPGRFTFTAIPA